MSVQELFVMSVISRVINLGYLLCSLNMNKHSVGIDMPITTFDTTVWIIQVQDNQYVNKNKLKSADNYTTTRIVCVG